MIEGRQSRADEVVGSGEPAARGREPDAQF